MFGDVNVKVEDGNLGRSSSTGTGTSIKIGISNVESKSPILISGTMNAKRELSTHAVSARLICKGGICETERRAV